MFKKKMGPVAVDAAPIRAGEKGSRLKLNKWDVFASTKNILSNCFSVAAFFFFVSISFVRNMVQAGQNVCRTNYGVDNERNCNYGSFE